MPWILLGFAVAITQIFYWVTYAVADPGSEDLLPPRSIVLGLTLGQVLAVVMVVIWSASALGSEYGWGTFRTVLVRGAGRWQFLAAQFSVMAATVLLWLVVVGAGAAVSSLLGGAFSGDGLSTAGQWSSVGETLGKATYAVLPYIALTMFFVVLSSSAGAATGLTMVYIFIIEGVVLEILAEFVKGFDVIADYTLGRAASAWLGDGDGGIFGTFDNNKGELHGFLVILVYVVALSGAAIWIFNKKDIGGPKGP